jgi:hypothetical protein
MVVVLFCTNQQTILAQSNDALRVSEQSVKAAYLYKFAGYVDWPDLQPVGSEIPINIGVVGSGSLADELARITVGRTINNRPISVRQITTDLLLEEIQVLFIGAQERNRLDEWLLQARTLPILTVTESEGALSEGSIINFTVNDQRVRFEVSLGAADQSRLRLDSRLLAVAQRVYRSTE